MHVKHTCNCVVALAVESVDVTGTVSERQRRPETTRKAAKDNGSELYSPDPWVTRRKILETILVAVTRID